MSGAHAVYPFVGAVLQHMRDPYIAPATPPRAPLCTASFGKLVDCSEDRMAQMVISLPSDHDRVYAERVSLHILVTKLVPPTMDRLRVTNVSKNLGIQTPLFILICLMF